MSTEIQFNPVACPECDSTLLPERLDDVAVLCANCRAVFVPADRRTEQRTSRKAVVSLVLGLLSLGGLFLTGIPAILLGVSALRDIKRASRALKGKYIAMGGIATGTVFGLMCGTCVSVSITFGIVMRNSMTQTDDPQITAEIAARLMEFEAPRGTGPLEAMEMGLFGIRNVVYGGDPRPDHPLIVVSQSVQGTIRQQAEVGIRNMLRNKDGRVSGSLEIEKTEQLEFTIGGQTVRVDKSIGLDRERGQKFRKYIAEIPNDRGLTFAALITPDEPSASLETPTVSLTEDEVRQFFESFR
jgi:hypothetical protein